MTQRGCGAAEAWCRFRVPVACFPVAVRRAATDTMARGKHVLVLWRALAVVAAALGAIGAVLPLLPTVPFLLVAAWAASHGWPEMEAWLLRHPQFGPSIRRWRERRAVPQRAKVMASVFMAASVAGMWLSAMPRWASTITTAFLLAVAVWLWTRPER